MLCVAAWQGPALEAWQKTGHHHARLTGATWADDSQQPSIFACRLLACYDPCHVLDQRVDKPSTSKEIARIVCRESMKPLIRIARYSGFFLRYSMGRTQQRRDGPAPTQVGLNGLEGCRVSLLWASTQTVSRQPGGGAGVCSSSPTHTRISCRWYRSAKRKCSLTVREERV